MHEKETKLIHNERRDIFLGEKGEELTCEIQAHENKVPTSDQDALSFNWSIRLFRSEAPTVFAITVEKKSEIQAITSDAAFSSRKLFHLVKAALFHEKAELELQYCFVPQAVSIFDVSTEKDLQWTSEKATSETDSLTLRIIHDDYGEQHEYWLLLKQLPVVQESMEASPQSDQETSPATCCSNECSKHRAATENSIRELKRQNVALKRHLARLLFFIQAILVVAAVQLIWSHHKWRSMSIQLETNAALASTYFATVDTQARSLQRLSETVNKMLQEDARLQENKFPESIILNSTLSRELSRFYGDQIRSWKLIYRGSRDGFRVSDFHDHCNEKGETITVLQVGPYIFGGYNPIDWDRIQRKDNAHSGKGWLFSLVNPGDTPPIKLPCINKSVASSSASTAIRFGADDLVIADQSNANNESFAKLGSGYAAPYGFSKGSDEANTFFCGSTHFRLSEIEVFAFA